MRTLTLFFLFSAMVELLGCVANLGHSDWQPDPPIAAIALGPSGSEPLTFRTVVYRIPVNSILGDVYVGARREDQMRWTVGRTQSAAFNVAVTDGLRRLGYAVRDEADSVFDPKERGKVRYEMAAILHNAEVEFHYRLGRNKEGRGEGVGVAEVEMEVQLYDAVEKRTVYSKRFQGRGREQGLKPNPMTIAVVNAILKSTGDPDFAAHVAIEPDRQNGSASPARSLQIARCPTSESRPLPGNLPQLMKSVVGIQAGSVGGTGVLVSPDGWILTAAHVVLDAPEVWVRFDNGAQLPASLHASDAENDLALLRVEGRNYPCAPIQDATKDLKLGSDVFAVNRPIGDDRQPSIARGVVSGFPVKNGRRFIQTDASLNPGSSGGPLLASSGEVAGITVFKVVGDGIEGLGLAVPASEAVRQLEILLIDD